MKRNILLVGLDLEPSFLSLPKLMAEDEWDIAFAASGKAAFELLAERAFDAAVVDLALPDLHGAQVLDEIKKSQPQMLRFVYAAPSSDPAKMKYWSTEHHWLIKPCTGRILRDQLQRAFSFMLWLPGKAAHGLISNLQMIPSPPALYTEIVRELQSPQGSIETVGRLIAKDPAMTAKVLQLANSAAFGLQQRVTDAPTAVMYLGVETVKSLILLTRTFEYFENFKPTDFSLPELWSHSLAAAQCASQIAREEKMKGELGAKVYTAGLLHDLGQLVLAVNLPGPFTQALGVARQHQIPLWKIERDLLGASHAEIGAGLLGLWGVPNEIVEAVAWHHEPSRAPQPAFGPLTVVHVANALAHENRKDGQGLPLPEIDLEYLGKLGMADRLPAWRSASQAV